MFIDSPSFGSGRLLTGIDTSGYSFTGTASSGEYAGPINLTLEGTEVMTTGADSSRHAQKS